MKDIFNGCEPEDYFPDTPWNRPSCPNCLDYKVVRVSDDEHVPCPMCVTDSPERKIAALEAKLLKAETTIAQHRRELCVYLDVLAELSEEQLSKMDSGKLLLAFKAMSKADVEKDYHTMLDDAKAKINAVKEVLRRSAFYLPTHLAEDAVVYVENVRKALETVASDQPDGD